MNGESLSDIHPWDLLLVGLGLLRELHGEGTPQYERRETLRVPVGGLQEGIRDLSPELLPGGQGYCHCHRLQVRGVVSLIKFHIALFEIFR